MKHGNQNIRQMPNALPLEEAVLGGALLDKDVMPELIEILKSKDCFYDDRHKWIYAALIHQYENNLPIDILTINERLKSMGVLEKVGGGYYLADLTNRIASTANIATHAVIIADKYIRRKLIKASREIEKMAFDDTHDVFEAMDKSESLVLSAGADFSGGYLDAGEIAANLLKEFNDRQSGKGGIGLSSNLPSLDRKINGFHKSDLIIAAARPGMGKTSFILGLAKEYGLDRQIPVGVFSLEMSTSQLANRIISIDASIEGGKTRGIMDSEDADAYIRALDRFSGSKIYIDDAPGLNILELRSKARKMKKDHGVEMIFIDYLQLMSFMNESGNTEQETAKISKALKGLAKELDIPVVALSQLSRGVEYRSDKRPKPSDLRNSGSIEQDADVIIFIYRDEFYDIMQDEDGNNTKGVAELIVSKNRHGAVGTAYVEFIDKYTRFQPMRSDNEILGISGSTAFPVKEAMSDVMIKPKKRDESVDVLF